MNDRRDLQADLERLVRAIRGQHPDAVVSTILAHADERHVVAQSSIALGDGRAGSGLGSAPAEDGAAELAENRALARAMVSLDLALPAGEPARITGPTAVDPPGRVVAFPTHEPEPAPDGGEAPAGLRPASPPRGRPEPAPQRQGATPGAPPRSAGPAATSGASSAGPAPAATGPGPSPRPAAPSRTGTASPASAAPPPDEDDPADLSWTAFWKWAREHGFSNKMALEEALGGSLGSSPPGEVRKLMREQLGIQG